MSKRINAEPTNQPPSRPSRVRPNWVKEGEPLDNIERLTGSIPDRTVLYVKCLGGSLPGDGTLNIDKWIPEERRYERTVINQVFTIKCSVLDCRWYGELRWIGAVRVLEIIGHNPAPNNLRQGSNLSLQPRRDRISLFPFRSKLAELSRKMLNEEYSKRLLATAEVHSELSFLPGDDRVDPGRSFLETNKKYKTGMRHSSDLLETVSDWLKTLNLDDETIITGQVEAGLLETKMITIDRRYMGIENLKNVLLSFHPSTDDSTKIKLALAERKLREENSYYHDEKQALQMLRYNPPFQNEGAGNDSITNKMLGGRKRRRKSRRKSRRKKIKRTNKRRKKRTKKRRKRKKNRTRRI